MKIVVNFLKNRQKGFTLIELLAVIVILAIIAVIAVPIVLNIIDETKKNASLRSVDFYLDAVEMSIATATLENKNISDGTYNIMSDGNICLGEYALTEEEGQIKSETCEDDDNIADNEILKVEVKGEKPTSGQIIIKDGQIEKEYNATEKTWLEISGKRIEPIEENGEVKFGIVSSENSKEETIEVGKMSICKPLNVQTEGTYTPGDKYECDVDPNKEGYDYTFYVLNATSTEVNLIMNANINASGEAVIPGETSDTGLVAWDSSGLNTRGPITAMQFLYNATKDWTNIDPISYEYKDKEYQGTTAANTSYTSFVADNGILTITAFDETTTKIIGTEAEPLRARMPIYAYKSGTEYGEVADKTANNTYLHENLDPNGEYFPYGYWTLSSYADDSYRAWFVDYDGYVSDSSVDDGGIFGARPVITLKI